MKFVAQVVFLTGLAVGFSASASMFYVSSQGNKEGFIKDAQTLEDFRYAATNEFDYVTFEIDSRQHPNGWLEESLGAIAGSGKRPWLVIKRRTINAKEAERVFAAMHKAGFKDSDIVVEAMGVSQLRDYTKGHPEAKRVLWIDFGVQDDGRRLFRVPSKKGVPLPDSPWPAILQDCRDGKLWGVRLPVKMFRVRKPSIDALHELGVKAIMYQVNDPVTGEYYRRAGADGFVTAQPFFTRGMHGEWPKNAPKKTLLFGHRGGEDNLAPEHSPALTQLAVKHKMDLIKLDLRRTKDGEIVTSHDYSVKRVFGVDKNISKMTLAELKQLVALPVAGYTNEHIQTLAEVFAIAKDGIPQFGLDFKDFTPEMAEQALSIVREAGIAESRILVITYQLKALAYMKAHHPNIRRVMHTSVYYLPRKGHYALYQDVPGNCGTCYPKDEPAREYATSRAACQRILEFYKTEYGLYGINIGVYVGGSEAPLGRFRVSPADIAFLQAGGLWVSCYMPTDPVTCDYYRRAGADAFITASAAGTYEN